MAVRPTKLRRESDRSVNKGRGGVIIIWPPRFFSLTLGGGGLLITSSGYQSSHHLHLPPYQRSLIRRGPTGVSQAGECASPTPPLRHGLSSQRRRRRRLLPTEDTGKESLPCEEDGGFARGQGGAADEDDNFGACSREPPQLGTPTATGAGVDNVAASGRAVRAQACGSAALSEVRAQTRKARAVLHLRDPSRTRLLPRF